MEFTHGFFHISMDHGAWPFFVDGVTCLVISVSVCEEEGRKRRERMKGKLKEKMERDRGEKKNCEKCFTTLNPPDELAQHVSKKILVQAGIRNMLFSTYSHTSHLLHRCFHCVLRLGDCLLCFGSGEVFAPTCFLSSILGPRAQRQKSWLPTFWWARSHASGAGFVRDPRAANWSTQKQHDGSSEWKAPRVWDCSSHFVQNGEAEEHPASP